MFKKINSTLKIGAANALNNLHYETFDKLELLLNHTIENLNINQKVVIVILFSLLLLCFLLSMLVIIMKCIAFI